MSLESDILKVLDFPEPTLHLLKVLREIDSIISLNLCKHLSALHFSSDDHASKGSGLAPWPARLTSPPPRLADFGYSSDMFEKDTVNIQLSISYI